MPFGKREDVDEEIDEESNKKWRRKDGLQSKKVMFLTKILLCTFLRNSFFLPSWFLMKL